MESTLHGLSITVVGMGLVFFALAIVMVVIIGLDRLFPGEVQAPARAEAAPPLPSASAAMPPAGVPGVARFQASVAGKSFLVETGDAGSKGRQFTVGDRIFKVERSKSSIGEILIDGEPHRVEVLGMAGGVARVKIGDQTLEVKLGEATVTAPAARLEAPAAAVPAGVAAGRPLPAPLPGKILRVLVAVGDRVKAGQELCVLEAMKMENIIRTQADGVVRHLVVLPGQSVSPGETLMWIE